MTTLKERAREQGKIDNLTRNRINISNRKQQQEEKEAEKENRRQKREEEEEEKRLEKKRQKEQKEALVMLQGEIRQLEQMKSELETLLQTSANRIEELEQELVSQENISIEMEESYKTQILELETELSTVQTTQLKKLTELHQTKIDVAVQEALRVQEIELCKKIEETTKRLGKDHAKEMEKEKLRSHKAVETERKKMRKLVRALALREKNLRLQHPSLLSSSPSSKEDEDDNEDEVVFKLAPFNPSSDQIQEKALNLLDLGPDDVLFDIGAGDARMLCFAAINTPGLRCVGIEIDEVYVSRARDRIQRSKLESRICIRLDDATKIIIPNNGNENDENNNMKEDNNDNDGIQQKPVIGLTLLDDATALYLFVLPKGIVKLMPILQSLVEKRIRDGKIFRIVSYMFKIHAWEPTSVDRTAKGGCPVYYYEFVPRTTKE